MKRTFTILLLFALTSFLHANNIVITNLSLTGKNTGSHYTMVQFDISWDNSWRSSSNESNWDAAWVFVKYRVAGGAWQHAWLDEAGHTAPSGSTIVTGLLTPGSAFNATTNPGLGAFIYRSADAAASTFAKTGVQLRWNYGANGVADGDFVEIKLFAIEMVYVPQGAFFVGSGGTESGCLTNGSWTSGASIPLSVSSEGALNIAQTAGSLWGTSSSGDNTIGPPGSLEAGFPKGYNAFYCMKYEISQKQYVDFLNTLASAQAANRYSPANTGNRYGLSVSGGIYSTTNPYVACNFISWMDGAAFTDWAGLRPMTELEFEKACRGTATPVAGEYAWGNTTATAAINITNGGANNEVTGTSGANAVFFNLVNAVEGPMRTGLFAKSSTTRAEAGSTYYGIMEMSGNLWERTVTVGNTTGRAYTGVHGNGTLSAAGNADISTWPGYITDEVTGAAGAAFRGGSFLDNYIRVSDRFLGTFEYSNRFSNDGFRAVRTQPVPQVTTTAATSITSVSAMSGGNVISDGGSAITARGVCWSTTSGPTIALTTKTTDGSGVGTYTSAITGLSTRTLYYVRAYATSSAGTSYGNEITFTTLGCFIAGTKITMANGSLKNIEEIKVGEKVKSVKTGTMDVVAETVEQTFANPPSADLVKITFSNGQSNTNTRVHPYWVVGKGWSCVDQVAFKDTKGFSNEVLKVGNHCLIVENDKLMQVTVTGIEYQSQLNLPTYNFTVSHTNCYFANGVLVHNKP